MVVIVGDEERTRGGVKIRDVCSRAEVSTDANFCAILFFIVKRLDLEIFINFRNLEIFRSVGVWSMAVVLWQQYEYYYYY